MISIKRWERLEKGALPAPPLARAVPSLVASRGSFMDPGWQAGFPIVRLTPGTVLGGKYRVLRLLGEGGMGLVYLAHHEALDQPVAIKLLAPSMAGNAEAAARFAREARAVAKLQSPHVVRVMDVGAFAECGPYIVMEVLEGEDLDSVVERQGPLPIARCVDHVLQALSGLSEAHALGIVHRDIKPSNLFLARCRNGSVAVKVLDFGISKMGFTGHPSDTTTSQAVFGTPHYMSPEQLRGSKCVDARADLWSIGVVLHYLLTGSMPFDGDTFGAVFASILETAPATPSALRPEIPEGLSAIVARCLRRSAEDRFATAAELAAALAPFGSRLEAPTSPPAAASSFSGVPVRRERGRWLRWIGGASLAAVGATVAVVLVGGAAAPSKPGDAGGAAALLPANDAAPPAKTATGLVTAPAPSAPVASASPAASARTESGFVAPPEASARAPKRGRPGHTPTARPDATSILDRRE